MDLDSSTGFAPRQSTHEWAMNVWLILGVMKAMHRERSKTPAIINVYDLTHA